MLRSLRGRLTLLTLVTTGLGLGLCSAAIYALVRDELITAFDDVLLADNQTMISFIEYNPLSQRFSFNGQDLLRAGGADLLVSAQTATGKPVISSAETITQPTEVAKSIDNITRFWDWTSLDGRHWRAVSRRQAVVDEDDSSVSPPIELLLSRPTTLLDHQLWRIAEVLICLTVGVCAILGTILHWGTQRALRPLLELTQQLGQRPGDAVAGGTPLTTTSFELQPVIGMLNRLFTRIDAAFQRERAMGSALAHELRTPLAGLRLVIDVATSRNRDGNSYRRALDECREMTVHLQRMVDGLLLLTRLERGHVPLRPQPVELGAVLQATWASLAERAAARQLSVTWDMQSTCTLSTDPDLLAVVIRNLLENAVDYTDLRGELALRLVSCGHRQSLTIANSCTQLTPGTEEQVFLRFWRGDQARSGEDRHCGLGLGLSRDIAITLGGSLIARITATHFTIVLELPTAPTQNT